LTEGLNEDFYHPNSGAGVDVYILDTGIYIEHNDFHGRARIGANFADNIPGDTNSHGTHCAGTVGGLRFGVAKQVVLISVKVLNGAGSGTFAGVISGIQWTTSSHGTTGGPSVASMSLGGATDGGMCAAVGASVAAGVVYSIAAGNSNGNACNFFPAGCPTAISVGSTDIADFEGTDYDSRSSFSNFGTCTHVFAPGSAITSAGITGPDSSSVKSGTSMACPHVSGIAAQILSVTPTLNPAQVKARIAETAQPNLIDNVGPGSPNLLLYNGC